MLSSDKFKPRGPLESITGKIVGGPAINDEIENLPGLYFHLGEISFKGGAKVKAKSMLQRAVSEAGEYPEATELLEQL